MNVLQNIEPDVAQILFEIIVNSGSGVGDAEESVRHLKEIFAERRVQAHFSIAHSGEELIELARRAAAKEDYQVIVAAGGDGTISAVASAIVGTNKILGVLPLGTLNHFAKDLGISFDLDEAANVILAGHTTKVDAAAVNERIFINNSSIGLYPRIVRRREMQQHRLGRSKWYAAFWATLAVLRRHSLFAVKIKTDTEELTRRTPFVFVGNNEYQMNFFDIGARQTLSDGKLSVYLLHRTGRLGLVKLVLQTIIGALKQAKDFEALSTAEMTIETRRKRKRLLVATDGEVSMMDAPLHYRILPNALRVIVPKIEPDAESENI